MPSPVKDAPGHGQLATGSWPRRAGWPLGSLPPASADVCCWELGGPREAGESDTSSKIPPHDRAQPSRSLTSQTRCHQPARFTDDKTLSPPSCNVLPRSGPQPACLGSNPTSAPYWLSTFRKCHALSGPQGPQLLNGETNVKYPPPGVLGGRSAVIPLESLALGRAGRAHEARASSHCHRSHCGPVATRL